MQCSETIEKSIFRFFAIFSFWDIVVKILRIVWKKKFVLKDRQCSGPLHPTLEAPPSRLRMLLNLNPSSQLVIGYHWLAFLNQVRKHLWVPTSLQVLSTRSIVSQKLKIVKFSIKYYSEYCASFRTNFLGATISQKLKIGKLIFHSLQNIVQLFGQKTKSALFEKRGGRGFGSACR